MEGASGNISMKQKAISYYSDCTDTEEEEEEEDVIGSLLHKLNLGPTKKLLVLSPGVLCQKIRSFNKYRPRICTPDAIYGSIQVYKRPHCEDFMKFCFERFEVGIWSSAIEKNLNNVLECLMGELRSKLLFAWDQEKCTNSGFNSLENKNKPLFFKELRKLWESNSSSLELYSSSDTLLIDDKPYKALLNPLNTGIFLDEYKAGQGNDTVLGPKGELRLFLDGLTEAGDVALYVKENPFGQPAITSDHPDWKFYSKIARHFDKEN